MIALGLTGLHMISDRSIVTLDSGPARAKLVVDAIAERTGRKLATGNVADTIVMLRVKDMPVDRLLKEIATVLDAEWEDRSGTLTLWRSKERFLSSSMDRAKVRGERFKAAIDRHLESRRGIDDWSSEKIEQRLEAVRAMGANLRTGTRVKVYGASDDTPEAILMAEGLRKCPPEMLGQVEQGSRVVFSTNPTPLQRTLPFRSSAASAYVEAYNRLAQLSSEPVASASGALIETPLNRRREPIRALGKWLFAVENRGDDVRIEAIAAGPDGAVLGSSSCTVKVGAESPLTPPADLTGSVALSPADARVAEAVRRGSEVPAFTVELDTGTEKGRLLTVSPVSLSAEAEARLWDPMRYEPLHGHVSHTISELARARQRNLVAFLPDSTFVGLASLEKGGSIALADVWRDARRIGIRIEEAEGLLRIHPLSYGEEFELRTDRRAFKQLLDRLTVNHGTDLDALAAYAQPIRFWSSRRLDSAVLGLLVPDARGEITLANWPLLQLWGALEAAARDRVAWETSVADLDSKSRSLIERALVQQGLRQGPTLAAAEPTEALLMAGRDLRLRIKRDQSPGVLAIDHRRVGRYLTSGDLALTDAASPELEPQNTRRFAKPPTFSLANIATLSIAVDWNLFKAETSLRDGAAISSRRIAWSELPADFLAGYRSAKREFDTLDYRQLFPPGQRPPWATTQ